MSTRAGRAPGQPRFRVARLLLCVGIAVMVPTVAVAQDQRAYLALSVNSVAQGDALVLLRDADALIGVATLEAAGLRGFTGRRETVNAQEFVSLASLAPTVTFRLDDEELRLGITADPALLATVVQDLDPGAPRDIVYRQAPSAFLNYSATAGTETDYEIFTESGISARGALFYTTATRSATSLTRGLSNLTIDRRTRLERWVFGDTFATAGPLGGDALIAGISVGREYSLAPYFVRHPTMSLSTPVATPSVLEVHVNGRLVREETVQPGRIDVRNLPMAAGSNDTRLVLRDSFGGRREITEGFYVSSSVLARGLHDYQYSFGWQRESLGTLSWDYRSPVALARHRWGITDSLTAGFRLEGKRGLMSGGPSLNLRLPIGEVEVAAGGSRVNGIWATAGQASYMYVGRAMSFGTQLSRLGRDYSNVGLKAGNRASKASASVFANIPLGPTSVTVQHSREVRGGAAAEKRTSIFASARLTRMMDVVTSLTHARTPERSGMEASVGLTLSLGARNVASVSAVRSERATQGVVELQRPLPAGTGVGYQFRAEHGDRQALSGSVEYQGEYGRYEVRRVTTGSASPTSVNVSGGLVAIGGGLHATRPVRNSYALIRVPGVEGVRTYSSNQEVGRTGRRGTVLIPDLLPYYGNRLSILDTDIPLDYEVPSVQLTLAPPYRGGAVALFDVRRPQRIVGSIVLATAQGREPPAFGSVALSTAKETFASPLGVNGEFYFENVPPGRHSAVVTHGQVTCEMVIEIPVIDGASVVLGELTCSGGGGR